MKKPTILVISKPLPQYDYLKESYNLIFIDASYDVSPFVQAEDILKMIRKKRLKIDGVFALLDFHSEISSIIAAKLGLPHTSTKSIYKAQNKAVFAELMKKANVPFPKTKVLDISSQRAPKKYPLFIRPIRGSFSAGAYMLHSVKDYEEAKKKILNDTKLVPDGFEDFLLHFNPGLKPLRNWFIAQPYMSTRQYVADGFVRRRKVQIFAITKAIYTKDRKSFMRYDFPTPFPPELSAKLEKIIEKLLQAVDYNNSGFNVEFFLTPENKIVIIELNTRITPGFLNLFDQRFAISPFEMMIQLSLGQKPFVALKENKQVAAGFPLRLKQNRWVTSVPTLRDKEKLKKRFGIIDLEVLVKKNTKLSQYRQDAYSYCYGRVDIAGKNIAEIKRKLNTFMRNRPIKLGRVKKDPAS